MVTLSLLGAIAVTSAQTPQPAISKDQISVHTVRRGLMPLRVMAKGRITAIEPPRAVVMVARADSQSLQIGARASAQIKPPQVLDAKVARIDNPSSDTVAVEIEFGEPLPAGAETGAEIGSLIRVGQLENAVFFERPADARPNTKSTIFLIEAHGDYAKRVEVSYGRQSGPLMEILSGLSPGDRVIVTDMAAWSAYERVRLK